MRTLNYLENYTDYMGGTSTLGSLMDVKGIPAKAYGYSYDPLSTHMLMMYRHMDWKDFVVKLDSQTIRLLQKKMYSEGKDMVLMNLLEPGMNVILVDRDTMLPVTYSQMSNSEKDVEVLTLDEAIHQAAYWFAQNFTDGFCGFALTSAYFLAAFRLAMMEGEMSDEDRFSTSRYNRLWREMYCLLLHEAGKQLMEQSTNERNSCCRQKFGLDESEINDYLNCIND